MSILLMSTGGGGGNILRSLKTLFARDVAIVQKTDASYAERLRRAVTTRFLDTNEFSLAQVPADERLLIGRATTNGLGSRHDPALAARALEESRDEIVSLIENYSIVVIIGTGGKGTGAGTIFPLADIVRRQNKLVLPVFVRPSFERHEVDKRRYDHALHVGLRFDEARIRLIEILNDHAYSDRDPQPQSVVWERMNLPIARGLRGLIYVLWDLSEVDPSDLAILLAGNGRMRIGFGELDPPDGHDPTDDQIREAVDVCWQNPYCAFTRLPGTSLVCIQGDWSNLADAKIKSEIAARALGNAPDPRYNPLYARAVHAPRPWGVTALFTEYTGAHQPMPLVWTSGTSVLDIPPTTNHVLVERHVDNAALVSEPAAASRLPVARPAIQAAGPIGTAAEPRFATIGDFARALNRLDPVALELAVRDPEPDIAIESSAVRRLVGAVWFRSIFPTLSSSWRERLLDALADSPPIPNHVLSRGRQQLRLADASLDDLKSIAASTTVSGAAGADLHLVLAIVGLWGDDARRRLRFVDVAAPERPSRFAALFGARLP
jgi:cell division GTPase FtsZ